MSGWIKLHRTLQKWGWRKKPKHVSVFLDILLEANHTDGEYMGVNIPRGSLTTSIEAISKRTGVTPKSIRTILQHLKRSNEVTIRATSHYTMISITKWDDYQLTGEATGNQVASGGQTSGKQRATNKNSRIKEDKNIASGTSLNLAESILEMFNQVCTRTFKPTEPNLRCIKARLKENYVFEDFKLVTEDRFKDWENNQKMRRFIQPKTLFNEDNFDGYLQTAKASLRPKPDPLKAILLSAGWRPESQTDESSESGDV